MDMLKLGFASVYSICKIPFNNIKNARFQKGIRPILVILAVLLLVLTYLILIPFWSYLALILIYLKLKHGKDFVKILDLSCAYFLYSERNTIKAIIYLDCKDVNSLYREVRRRIKIMLSEVPEYSSAVKKCLGYYYLLKQPISIQDVVSVISVGDSKVLTNEIICNYLAENETDKEPLFRIKIFKEATPEGRHVLVILTHHVLSDGHSISSVCHKYLFDKKIISAPSNRNFPSETLELNELYMKPEYFKVIRSEELLLPSENSFFALYVEEDGSCLLKLKFIKKALNCSINELVMAVISYSLFRHLKRRLGRHPKSMFYVHIGMAHEEYRKQFLDGSYSVEKPSNNATLTVFLVDNISDSQNFVDFLNFLRKEYREIERSMAPGITRFAMKCIFAYLPEFAYRAHIKKAHARNILFVFSNVGVVRENEIDGNKIINFTYAMNILENGGMFICYCSYDGKLQIVVGAKLHILQSREELQSILDDAVAFIHQLYDEIKPKEE